MSNETIILDFCNKVSATSSTTKKKEIIASYKGNEVVEAFLKFMFDKLIVTGISTKKLTKQLKDGIACEVLTDIIDVMEYLKHNNTGSDADVGAIQNYLSYVQVSEEGKAVLSKIITKSLKLGMDTKLINTAIPKLITVHEVQQALAIQNVTLSPKEWICLSQKLNGNRATFIDGKIVSRQGKEFTNIDHIIEELKTLNETYGNSMVFDGEIIRKNVDNVSDNENFRFGTGVLNSDDEDKTCLSFVIFDMLPLADFLEGESKHTYSQRLDMMLKVTNDISWLYQFKHVDVVPFLYWGTDHSMIETCLAQMDESGKEGCMLARDVTYKCKRHNGLLKVKTFYTMDLKIVGFETGTGKNEHTLGNLIVEYKDNTVGVGSGFTDEQRDWFWANRDALLGRVVEVKYKDITKDKGTGKESLQFPVFVQLREVGKTVSYN